MRQPRPPRQTERQKRTEAYRAEWKKNRRLIAVAKRGRRIRGQDIARALQLCAEATGDPRFIDSVTALRFHNLDHEFQRNIKRAKIANFGGEDAGYLVQVEFLHRYRRLSVLEASERVAAESGLPGRTFAAAVEQLRKAYLARKADGINALSKIEASRRLLKLDELLAWLLEERIIAAEKKRIVVAGKSGQKVGPLPDKI